MLGLRGSNVTSPTQGSYPVRSPRTHSAIHAHALVDFVSTAGLSAIKSASGARMRSSDARRFFWKQVNFPMHETDSTSD